MYEFVNMQLLACGPFLLRAACKTCTYLCIYIEYIHGIDGMYIVYIQPPAIDKKSQEMTPANNYA